MLYPLIKKFLFSLDPETAHVLAKNITRFAPKKLVARTTQVKNACLTTRIGDTVLANPVGLAAGFDKTGDMVDFLSAAGFGYLELGSITAFPCGGNTKPRIFRLPKDECLINRMGLPNAGAEAFARKMRRKKLRIPYGINIAKTPANALPTNISGIDDFLLSFEKLSGLGSYITLNLSCPNTEDGKTFEEPELFSELMNQISSVRKKKKDSRPLFVKLSPVLSASALKRLVELALRFDVDGFVLTNTTPLRLGLKTSEKKLHQIGRGGLSGKALLSDANKTLKAVYEIVGKKKTLIGVGGILDFEDLLGKISFGASLFQVYTGFIYRGPLFVRDLNRALAQFCEKQGVKNYQELVGEKVY